MSGFAVMDQSIHVRSFLLIAHQLNRTIENLCDSLLTLSNVDPSDSLTLQEARKRTEKCLFTFDSITLVASEVCDAARRKLLARLDGRDLSLDEASSMHIQEIDGRVDAQSLARIDWLSFRENLRVLFASADLSDPYFSSRSFRDR